MAVTVPNFIMWLAATVAAVWKLSQVARVPDDRYLRAVAACTFAVFVALSAQLLAATPDGILGPHLPKLVQNVVLTFFFSLLLIVLQASVSSLAATRRARFEVVLAGMVAAGLIATFVATAPSDRGASYEEAAGSAHVVVFFLLGNAYMAYATARGANLSWQAAGQTRSRARLSLRVAGIGLGICCLGTHVPRVIATGGYLLGLPAEVLRTELWTTPLLAVGIAVFFLGIGYPGARTGMVKAHFWLEARWRYFQLRPLWLVVYHAYPNIALFPAVSWWRELLQVRNMRLRYYRRVIECRDGLVCMSPHLHANFDNARDLAVGILALVNNESRGRPSLPRAVLAEPTGESVQEDVTELLKLSRELRKLGRADSSGGTSGSQLGSPGLAAG